MVALPAENDRHEPLPLDPSGKRLCLTFPYLWQAIVAGNESNPQWQTLTKYPLRPRVLWRLWQDAAQLVGVRFDDQTGYALIDIDIKSAYHPNQNPDALDLIRAALETIGLYRIILLRSSWSGGLHLYIPLPELVPTFGLASALQQCLTAQGMTIAQGQLEVFPNCKSYALKGSYSEYNAHRLPLQPASGSCLLNNDANPVGQDLGRFFEQWDLAAAAQDMGELRAAISTARSNRRGKRQRQLNDVEAWLSDLRTEMQEGWTGHGQTNHLLKTIACYGVVFEGLKDEELVEFIYTAAINSPGFYQWCRHQHQIKLKAAVWARSAAGYYWRLGDERQREHSFAQLQDAEVIPISKNIQRSEAAQQRIRTIVSQLEAEGTLPATPTARAKMIAALGVSLKTLYRHPELWHPDHSIGMERWCKTPDMEPDIASEAEKLSDPPESLEPSQGKEFYTLAEQMKGKASEPGLVLTFPPPTARRSRLSEQSSLPASTRQRLRHFEGIQLQFPQLVSPDLVGLSHLDAEVECEQALAGGDRAWVLRRLFGLWHEGRGELIRAICQRHPGWRFQLGQDGPVEVDCDVPEI